MYQRSNTGLASYGRIANSETDPIKQVVMLYDGAIKFLNLTATDIEADNLTAKAEHSTRALDIITHLQNTLNFELGGSVAVNLDNLYRSVTVLVLRGSAELDAGLMRKAASALTPVRDAWHINSQKSATSLPLEMSASY